MQIFVYFKFHFDNDERPCEKIILRCFSKHKMIYLCAEFQLSQTPSTGFLPIDIPFFANIVLEYFFNKFLRVSHSQNWNYEIQMKFEQKLALYFYKFLKALIVWIAA